ncbi:MAG: S9 family peptidase [Chitinophagaceae bacterium]|nr:S9 family peptidase [Chitinophagaceae bacterium]
MKKNLLFFLVLPCFAIAQDRNSIQPTSNLVVEGIPSIPASLAQQVKKYTESRSAVFSSWHPVKREMLIGTRFGNVPQLHQVKIPMGARKQVTFFDEPITGSTYEPVNGSYFLFTKDIGGNEFAQIYRYDIKDGNVTLLTDGKRSQNGGMVWSTKGDRIAYMSTSRNGADRDIYVMDPKDPSTSKMVLQLQGGGWGVADWSPDDKTLLVVEGISVNEIYLWLVDVATGKKTPLTSREEKGVAVSQPSFSKDGKSIYFTTDKDNEFLRLAWMDIASKKTTYITSSIPWNVELVNQSKDGKYVAFITNEAGESKLYLLTTANNKYTPVKGLPQGVYGGLSFHPNSNDLALSINNARLAADVYVVSANTGKVERWTESELGGLVPEELQMPDLVKWKSFDGREISGFYFKPAAKFKGKRPVIINIHGGPEGQSVPSFQGWNNYYMNELGIAMIYPNVRGSSGYGKTFLMLDNGIKREESVQDIGALLDWIAKEPSLDASRVMVTGGSYGGYMTLAVATNYNDRIRCALDVVGISHFGTFLKNTESYRRDLRRVEYGDERDPQIAAFFEKMAPLNNASKIKKPIFIVQGGNDPRVPRTEAVQMVEKIKTNGGNVWYLEAKDEGHGFRKKNNIDFQRFATVLFIQKYLLDGMNETVSQ